jgi:hypothetical protein
MGAIGGSLGVFCFVKYVLLPIYYDKTLRFTPGFVNFVIGPIIIVITYCAIDIYKNHENKKILERSRAKVPPPIYVSPEAWPQNIKPPQKPINKSEQDSSSKKDNGRSGPAVRIKIGRDGSYKIKN